MKKAFSALLALAMLLSLAACGGGSGTAAAPEPDYAELIIGSWKMEQDVTAAMVEDINSSMAQLDEMVTELNLNYDMSDFIDNLVVTMFMEFRADGSYAMSIDESSLSAMFAELEKGMTEFYTVLMRDTFRTQLAAAGVTGDLSTDAALDAAIENMFGKTFDELVQEGMGGTMEEYVSSLMADSEEEIVGTVSGLVEDEGKYEVEGSSLYTFAADAARDDAVYETISIDGDTLTVLSGTGGDNGAVYPVILTRIA